jgi:hypothetical protein
MRHVAAGAPSTIFHTPKRRGPVGTSHLNGLAAPPLSIRCVVSRPAYMPIVWASREPAPRIRILTRQRPRPRRQRRPQCMSARTSSARRSRRTTHGRIRGRPTSSIRADRAYLAARRRLAAVAAAARASDCPRVGRNRRSRSRESRACAATARETRDSPSAAPPQG